MQYITGVHALNLPCMLDTCGDWHQSAIQWDVPQLRESEGSFFGEYGLEKDHVIPEHNTLFVVANTIRALLDLLVERNYALAQGMNDDFICNSKYDNEVFSKVSEMRVLSYWDEIDRFMCREYRTKWLKYKEACKNLKTKNAPYIPMAEARGFTAHSINSIAIMKANAYAARDKLRDLYDLTYIVNNKIADLNPFVVDIIRSVVETKGMEQFDYLTRTQSDDLIDTDELADSFLQAYATLGLIDDGGVGGGMATPISDEPDDYSVDDDDDFEI